MTVMAEAYESVHARFIRVHDVGYPSAEGGSGSGLQINRPSQRYLAFETTS